MSAVRVSRTLWVNRALNPLADSRRASGGTSRRMSPRSMRPAGLGWIIANCLRRGRARDPLLWTGADSAADGSAGVLRAAWGGAEPGVVSWRGGPGGGGAWGVGAGG